MCQATHSINAADIVHVIRVAQVSVPVRALKWNYLSGDEEKF